MRFGVKRHWIYFMYPNFGYYQTPSQVHFALVMRKYKTTLGGLLKPFKSTALGYKWNYAKNDSLYYLQQEFKPFYQNRIRTIVQETHKGRGVESCVSENLRGSSIKFAYDFVLPENRPKIFTHSFVTDPEKYAYLKFSQKRRKNKVDTDHCSRLLMERSLNNDELYSAKLGLKFNEAYDFEAMTHNVTVKASTEVSSNFTDLSYLKSKFFTRYSLPLL